MALACIGIGSNLNDPQQQVLTAIKRLSELPNSKIDAQSQLYQTKPWGLGDQPDFINAVVGLKTDLEPKDLLTQIQKIENHQGRIRETKWGPRLIDLDIICFAQLEQNDPELILPHPYFSQRTFVLSPLKEIYPKLIIKGNSCQQWFDSYVAAHHDEALPKALKNI